MTKVTITPEMPGSPVSSFRASAGMRESVGQTPGAALDALTKQLGDDDTGTLIVIQNMRPDSFFNADQQQRLGELMDKWRAARDNGRELSPVEQAELETLVGTELDGSARRSEAMAAELLT